MQTSTVSTKSTDNLFVVKYSDSDIVQEEDQNRLMFWRDTFRVGQFDIGDIACKSCDESAKSGMFVTQQRIYDAIGRYCGRSGRTVRYYAETSRFFSIAAREEYDMLPFSHFVLARAWGEHWREVLDYSMAHPGMTEKSICYQFNVVNDANDRIDAPSEILLDEKSSLETLSEHDNNQQTTQSTSGNVVTGNMAISLLSSLLDQFEKVLLRCKLRDDTQRKIADLLAGVRSVIPEILNQIDSG